MAKGVFTTKVSPAYDDLPELRYHFPKAYLNQVKQTLNDWIVYYEPRREDSISEGNKGRKAYFATAHVKRIEPDRARVDHFYAYVDEYLEFANAVPFRNDDGYFEGLLCKPDGSTNKGAFRRAVRIIQEHEYEAILHQACRGFEREAAAADVVDDAAEEPAPYGRTDRIQILRRPLRQISFTHIIQEAYNHTCAVTGLKLINGGERCEIEAGHIRPVADQGPDSPRNGIALSRTIHWMFDRGILSLADTGEILMAKGLVPLPVQRMINPDRQVAFPKNPIFRPHPVFLKFHRENIYKGE
jgi:putative restriction endonuclease